MGSLDSVTARSIHFLVATRPTLSPVPQNNYSDSAQRVFSDSDSYPNHTVSVGVTFNRLNSEFTTGEIDLALAACPAHLLSDNLVPIIWFIAT